MNAAVTGRSESIFQQALHHATDNVEEAIKGRTLLIAGAAGSIGSATTHVIASFNPRALVLVDTDENGLAELVRSLRSSGSVSADTLLHPILLDITSPWVDRIADSYGPLDGVLNFAASKHVRSERDVLSLLRMYDVNVRGTMNLGEVASRSREEARFFSVSSDKAANPTSLMGASKRLMELEMARGAIGQIASCRFANVAFSSGSLLESWLRRIALGQPVAVPRDIRRYFITHEEAGQLCLVGFAESSDAIFVPALSAESDLRPLTEVLKDVLAHLGREPVFFDNESEAIANAPSLARDARQSVIVTTPDTSGEKLYEEFTAGDETAQQTGIPAILQTQFARPPGDESLTMGLVAQARGGDFSGINIEAMIDAVASDVPTFVRTARNGLLDDRV